MDPETFAEQVSGVAALAEPVRRDLYLYVVSHAGPVSREQACEGVEVAHHTAKFHLDRLVAAGLLDVEYRRPSGRRGPGAGRPTKLYSRSGRQLSVSVPERRYDLAAHLLARAVEGAGASGAPDAPEAAVASGAAGTSGAVDAAEAAVASGAGGASGAAVVAALHAAAGEQGAVVGDAATALAGSRPTRELVLAGTCAALAVHGYQPRRDGDIITLSNCPFLTLARAHPELVCGMNLALLSAAAGRVGLDRLDVRLEPATDRCCVVLEAR